MTHLILIFLTTLVIFTSSSHSVYIYRPTTCDRQETWFKHGHSYMYNYHLETKSGTSEATSSDTHHVICKVVIDVPRKCEMVLKVERCTVGQSDDRIEDERSLRLTEEMKQFPVYFKYNRGEVVDYEIFVSEREPLHITNLKRGIISLLQLKIMSTKEHYGGPLKYHDVLGTCKTQMKLVPGSDHQMESHRDLNFCNMSGLVHYQNGAFASVQTMQDQKPLPLLIQMMSAVESTVWCNYTVSPKLSMKEAHCSQQLTYSPMLFSGHLMTDISQSMTFVSRKRFKSKSYQRFLDEYVSVDLEMDFNSPEQLDVSEDTTERSLEQAVADLASMEKKDVLATKSFKTLVSNLRLSNEEQLRNIKDSLFTCKDENNCFKYITSEIDIKTAKGFKRALFVSGLKSCGSESCQVVLAEMILDGDIEGIEMTSTLFNMGLFYQPNVNVLTKVHEHCSNNPESTQCWLSLSAMLNRLKSKRTKEVDDLLKLVLQSLTDLIGNKCDQHSVKVNPAKMMKRDTQVLTALKALANIGQLSNDFEDKIPHVDILLDCVSNKQGDFLISQNAVNTITKLGLQHKTSCKLMRHLQDDNTKMILRSTIFDVLIFQEDKEQLQQLFDVLNITALDNMKTYIVTKVTSILESPDPALFSLQTLLLEVMQGRIMPDVKKIFSRSHYAEASHHFTVPFMPLKIGFKLGISVIFNPGSNFFQLGLEMTLNDEKINIIEISFYLEGADTILDFIEEVRRNPEKVFSSRDMMKNFQMYIHKISKGELPKFDKLKPMLMRTVKKIFTHVNMKKISFPRAHISVKLLGYDVGFFSSETVLKLLKERESHFKKKVIHAILNDNQWFQLIAFKLVDFHQIFPTICGIPLEVEMDSTFIRRALINSTGVLKHLNEGENKFTSHWSLLPSMSTSRDAKISLTLKDYFTSDLRHEALTKMMASTSNSIDIHTQQYQRHPRISFGVTKYLGDDTFTFLDMRSEVFLMTGQGKRFFNPPQKLQQSFEKCLPQVYTKIFGHKICINGNFYRVSSKNNGFIFPLMASEKITGVITRIDKSLVKFKLSGNYQTASGSFAGYYAQANFEGRGSDYTRKVNFVMQHGSRNNNPILDCQLTVEDVNVVFTLHSAANKSQETFAKDMSVSITQNEMTTHSLSTLHRGTIDLKTKSMKEITTEANFVGANGDLSITFFNKANHSLATNKQSTEMTYHCKPSLPLLYALHTDPLLASKSGHTSKFSLLREHESSMTSYAETWRGTFKDIVLIPGHNITHISHFVADLTGANRTTNITWTAGRQTHSYNVYGHVKNKTVLDLNLNDYDYKMHLVKVAEYEIDLDGYLTWKPMDSFKLEGEVNYVSLKEDDFNHSGRKKRSLSSILRELKRRKKKVENLIVKTYKAAKSELWTLLSGKKTPKTKTKTVNNSFAKFEALTMKDTTKEAIRQEKNLKSFVDAPKWDMAFNVDLNMNKKPNVFEGIKMLLLTKGNAYKGRSREASGILEDRIHHVLLEAEMEHIHNEEIFFHHHKWHLHHLASDALKEDLHAANRSYEMLVHYQHFKHLECDMKLTSDMNNFTFHLNYTKLGSKAPRMHAHAFAHSLIFPFDLQYNETTDMENGELHTNVELRNTYLDVNLTLSKTRKNKQLNMDGEVEYKLKLPFYMKDGRISSQVRLQPKHPPVCRFSYYSHLNQEGIQTSMTFLGPKKIQIKWTSLPDNSTTNGQTETYLVWTLDLISPRVLQHSVKLSPAGTKKMQVIVNQFNERMNGVGMKNYKDKQDGSDPRFRIISFPKKSLEEKLQHKLDTIMSNNPNSLKAKILKLLIATIKTWNHMYETSAIGIIVNTFHLDEGMALGTKLLTKTMKSVMQQPPFFMRHFAKLYIYPDFHSFMRGHVITFSTSLSFVLESFKQTPHGTFIDKEIMEEMQGRKSKHVSSYRDIAVLMDGGWIRTFDGQWLNIADSTNKNCVHLLAGDFKRNKFVILYSKTDGVTIASQNYGIKLKTNGIMFSLDGEPIRSLPYVSSNHEMSMNLTDGKLSLTISPDLARVTLDTVHNYYMFETSKALNNASVGLLGTNNKEPGDDFQLVNGEISDSSLVFQNNFELSQSQHCHAFKHSPEVSCDNNKESVCEKFFHTSHNHSICTLHIDPKPFYIQCLKDTCSSKFDCGTVHAYASACQLKGLNMILPLECESCHNKMDIVFIQSLHEESIGDDDNVFGLAQKCIDGFTNSNIRIGFVTYGGNGDSLKPKAVLFGKRLFKHVTKKMTLGSSFIASGTSVINPDEGIQLASHYPFREGSIRIIVLFHNGQPSELSSDQSKVLLDTLKRRNIHFISAAVHPNYDGRGIIGVLHNGETIGADANIKLNDEPYSNLVRNTKGAWMSTNSLQNNDSGYLQQFVQSFECKIQ